MNLLHAFMICFLLVVVAFPFICCFPSSVGDELRSIMLVLVGCCLKSTSISPLSVYAREVPGFKDILKPHRHCLSLHWTVKVKEEHRHASNGTQFWIFVSQCIHRLSQWMQWERFWWRYSIIWDTVWRERKSRILQINIRHVCNGSKNNSLQKKTGS